MQLRRTQLAFAALLLTALPAWLCLPAWASRVVKDETGRAVTLPDHPHRVVALAPSIVDDLYSIGAGDDLAGVTDYVRYPAEARRKPSIGSIIDPSLENILALHPDLVFAMPHASAEATLDGLARLHIPVYLLDPHGLAGVVRSVTSVGDAMNRQTQASAVVAALTQRIAAVRARVAALPPVTVFDPLSFEPVITIGRGAFITEIIAAAGGRSITDDLPSEWPQVSLEVILARNPQAFLMMRDGKLTIDLLRDRPGWSKMTAVRERKVFYVDERIGLPSPVAISALEDLSRELHP